MAYIYKISNNFNNKIYIGYTTSTIEERFKEHLYRASKKLFKYSKLYSYMNKYGCENFKIETIQECLLEEMKDLEIYYILLLDTYYNGLNNTKGGDGCLGYKHTNETKNLLSLTPNIKKDKSYEEIYNDPDIEKDKRSKGASNYWSSLTDIERLERCSKNKNRKSKYSVALITEIKSLLNSKTDKELKNLYPDVNYSLFNDLRKGRRWKHL